MAVFKRNTEQKCCVPLCKSVGKCFPDIIYHRFPKPEQTVSITDENGVTRQRNRKQLWIEKLCLIRPVSQHASRVCSLHFKKEDYQCSGWSSKKMLLHSAIPSIINHEGAKRTEIGKRLIDPNLLLTPQQQKILKSKDIKIEPKVLFTCQVNIREQYFCKNCKTACFLKVTLAEHVREFHDINKKWNFKAKKYTCTNCVYSTCSKLHFLKHFTSQCIKLRDEGRRGVKITESPQFRFYNWRRISREQMEILKYCDFNITINYHK